MSTFSELLLLHLQSIVNSAARLIYQPGKDKNVMSILCELHWLKVPERITFWLCMLTYHRLNGMAPDYMSKMIHPVTNHDSRYHLRSSGITTLPVPVMCRSTLGDRSFLAAAATVWNSLLTLFKNTTSFSLWAENISVQWVFPCWMTAICTTNVWTGHWSWTFLTHVRWFCSTRWNATIKR